MTLLALGAKGPLVKRMQEALNAKVWPYPKLPIDSYYGPQTKAVVKTFQNQFGLVEDGMAGASTQAAAFDEEWGAPIMQEEGAFIPQDTPHHCWAAAMAMLTGRTINGVIARTPADQIAPSGGLYNYAEAEYGLKKDTALAWAHRVRCYGPACWPVKTMWSMLSSGPIVCNTLWKHSDYTEGKGSPGHWVLVVGIRGDGNPDGRGTTLRIWDPWPVNEGAMYSVNYRDWINSVPARTYRIFTR